MKPLFTLTMLVVLISCNAPVNNNTKANEPANRLVNYVNNIALSTPGWDNNDITINDFYAKLCARFNKDIKDSNLLKGALFSLDNLSKEENNLYIVDLKVFGAEAPSLPNGNDSTRIHFNVSAVIPDSLAKSIKKGELYYIESYTKDKGDSTYFREMDSNSIMQNYQTHTIYFCYLGSYFIHLQRIKSIDGQ